MALWGHVSPSKKFSHIDAGSSSLPRKEKNEKNQKKTTQAAKKSPHNN